MISVNRTRGKRSRSTPKDGTVAVSAQSASLNLARKVNKLTKLVKGIQPEVKIFDRDLSTTQVSDTGGGIVHVTAIAGGDSNVTRVGDTIRIRKIELAARLSVDSASIGANPSGDEYVRCFLVQDTQQVASTTPTVSDIMFLVGRPQEPFRRVATQNDRFRLLWIGPLWSAARVASTRTIAALATPIAPTQTAAAVWRKRTNIVVKYADTSSSGIQKNGIYFVTLTNIAADTVDVDGTLFLHFTDN